MTISQLAVTSGADTPHTPTRWSESVHRLAGGDVQGLANHLLAQRAVLRQREQPDHAMADHLRMAVDRVPYKRGRAPAHGSAALVGGC